MKTEDTIMQPTTRLCRLPEVLALTGYKSPDTIYRLENQRQFPARIKLSRRASRWRLDEVMEWIEQRSLERTARETA